MSDKPVLRPRGRYKLQYRGTECKNCGHPLDMSDRFCPNCSQANSIRKLTLRDFFEEFFSSLFDYDSKLLKTFSALLLRPGKITKDYIDGKRISYTNPFRFLLSLSILYFLMLNVGGDFDALDNLDNIIQTDDEQLEEGILTLNIKNDRAKEAVKMDLDSIADIKGLNKIEKERDSLILADPKAYFQMLAEKTKGNRLFLKSEFFYRILDQNEINTFDEAEVKYAMSNTFENRISFNAGNNILKIKSRPGSYLSDLISKLPFVIFFFLPVFALFISLVYIRKKYTYTDHLIFSFHNTSLLFILLIISYMIDTLFDVYSSWIFFAIFSTYLFYAMRKFYQQGAFKTLVKYLFLNGIFCILAIIAMFLLSAGSLITY